MFCIIWDIKLFFLRKIMHLYVTRVVNRLLERAIVQAFFLKPAWGQLNLHCTDTRLVGQRPFLLLSTATGIFFLICYNISSGFSLA